MNLALFNCFSISLPKLETQVSDTKSVTIHNTTNNYHEMIINSLFRHVFFVGFCTFVNMYRRDLLWHLREHHRKTGYSDEMMLREMVKWPKDLRKIVCIKCTESEANENSTWLCCDPNEVHNFLC